MTTSTTDDLAGVLRRDGDRVAVTFERRYQTDPADLWSAVTTPERLARWLGRVQVPDARGGRYRIEFAEDDPDQVATGVVERCDPPSQLALTWEFPGEPASWVDLVLTPVGGGTLLRLDHRQLPTDQAAGYGAGWHAHLGGLTRLVTGADARSWDEEFTAVLPAYRDQATALS